MDQKKKTSELVLVGPAVGQKKKPYSDSPSYTDTPLNQEEDRHMMVTEKR